MANEACLADHLRTKPAYGDPCNNCGMCCIAVQCPLSLALFGEQGICPALGMAEPGNFGCRLIQAPQEFQPEISDAMVPVMSEYYAMLIGAGVGCDGAADDEEPTAEQRAMLRERGVIARKGASPEALALFHYVTATPPPNLPARASGGV